MYVDQYTPELKKHFLDPHNMGSIKPDELAEGEFLATGTVGNPKCGDLMKVYLRIKDCSIKDIKVETFGCASAIACSSVTTDLAKGKTLGEAKNISRLDAANALGGLPPIKMHCSNLAADALHVAIANFEKGKNVFDRNGPVTVQQLQSCHDDIVSSNQSTKGPSMEKTAKSNKEKTTTTKITKTMLLSIVADKYPQAAPILMQFGMHCIGCHIAAQETVEEGARAHGMSDEQITQMVEAMNNVAAGA
jgi:nitrogen fixation NifU-like protein